MPSHHPNVILSVNLIGSSAVEALGALQQPPMGQRGHSVSWMGPGQSVHFKEAKTGNVGSGNGGRHRKWSKQQGVQIQREMLHRRLLNTQAVCPLSAAAGA